jgi:hypothetical protein
MKGMAEYLKRGAHVLFPTLYIAILFHVVLADLW